MNITFKSIKERCGNCASLVDWRWYWWCDEADCPCDEVTVCMEWPEGAVCEEYERVTKTKEDKRKKTKKKSKKTKKKIVLGIIDLQTGKRVY